MTSIDLTHPPSSSHQFLNSSSPSSSTSPPPIIDPMPPPQTLLPPTQLSPPSPSPSPSVHQLLDLGSLTSDVLPDLSLNSIHHHHHQLSLDLGPTDLSVSLDELRRSKQSNLSHPRSSNPTTTFHPPLSNSLLPHSSSSHDQLPLSFDPLDRSRRWTSLSELGKSVVKASVASSTYRARSLQRPPPPHDGSLSHLPIHSSISPLPPSSLYSSLSTRNRLNVFKLWNHHHHSPDSPLVASPPPSSNPLPVLPPMSELLNDSIGFDKDLGSIIDLTINEHPDLSSPTPIPSDPAPIAQRVPSPSSAGLLSPVLSVSSPIVLSIDPVPQAQDAHSPAIVIDPQVEKPPSSSFQGPRHSESSVPNSKSLDPDLPITKARVLSMSEGAGSDPSITIDQDILSKLPNPSLQGAPEPSLDHHHPPPPPPREGGDDGEISNEAPTKPPSTTTPAITTTSQNSLPPHTKPVVVHHTFLDSLRRKKKPGSSSQPNFFKLLFLKGIGHKPHVTSTTPSSS